MAVQAVAQLARFVSGQADTDMREFAAVRGVVDLHPRSMSARLRECSGRTPDDLLAGQCRDDPAKLVRWDCSNVGVLLTAAAVVVSATLIGLDRWSPRSRSAANAAGIALLLALFAAFVGIMIIALSWGGI